MTTAGEQAEAGTVPAAADGTAYVQFGIPGVAFSAIRVPLADDAVEAAAWIDRALKASVYLRRKYLEAFDGSPIHATRMEPDEDGITHEPVAASEQVRVTVDANGEAQFAGGTKVTGERFACPQCQREAKPSVERYQEWEPGPDGRLYAQKFFCPNNDCATKSLWRSKLVPLTAGVR